MLLPLQATGGGLWSTQLSFLSKGESLPVHTYCTRFLCRYPQFGYCPEFCGSATSTSRTPTTLNVLKRKCLKCHLACVTGFVVVVISCCNCKCSNEPGMSCSCKLFTANQWRSQDLVSGGAQPNSPFIPFLLTLPSHPPFLPFTLSALPFPTPLPCPLALSLSCHLPCS